jgi:hypothetical protein
MTITTKLTELTKRSFIEMMKDVGTSIPGHFIAFDPDTQLAQIQIGVVRIDRNGKTFTPPPLIECPVYFAGGSEYFIEHQIDPGDECLIIFSQRCIDAWVNTGNVAQQPIIRFHDFSDACILPGLRSQPNKISSFENNGVRLRNKTGDKFIWLKNDGTAEITVDTLIVNGNIEHTGDTQHTGNTTQTGTTQTTVAVISPTITAQTSLTVNGKEMDQHKHLDGTYVAGTVDVTGISGEPV